MPYHYHILALIQVPSSSTDPEATYQTLADAKQIEGVHEAYPTVGRFDAVVHLNTERHANAIRALDRLGRLQGVEHIQALVDLHEHDGTHGPYKQGEATDPPTG